MCLEWETRWQKHLQPAPHLARVRSITELHNHCYALKSSEFYRILAILQCCDRFQGSARCTAPPHPLLRDIFLGDITNCSTCPGTGTQLHSWSSKMVLGPLENAHISGRCAFPSTKPVKRADWVSRTVVERNHEAQRQHQPKSLSSPSGASNHSMMLNNVQEMFFIVFHFSGWVASHIIWYFGTGKIRTDPKMQVLLTRHRGMPQLCMLDPPWTVDVHPEVRFTE